ncbi:hypothetical protein GCK72_020789 [Caenorhabditis remanei]|uniref:Uncharacterized protein n=1 Tax=Caenorhabditis remanei TaxID=31234 RepID=A0A6A5GII1_CAERE|nr:hypothetical protein GCK72_020789 [Caenorhabditis remanei]KAF1754229.1 hypothetical protein GCK72_020789 [Caenorhabditis remanei]
MLTTDTTILVASLAGYLLFSGSQAGYFLYNTFVYLFKSKTLSTRTLQMQRKFFKALCIQAAIPLMAVISPCIYIQVSAGLTYVDMMWSNFSMILLNTHGIWSTLTMLWVHKAYRQTMFEIFFCKKPVSSVTSTYANSIVKL